MPATRTGEWDHPQISGEITVEANFVDEEEPVYHTTDAPEIEFVITNNSDEPLGEFTVQWFVAIGDGRPEPLTSSIEKFDSLDADRKHTFSITEELLIEGHCLVGVGKGRASANSAGEWHRFGLKRISPDEYTPLLSFTVWDPDHYEVIHGDTKRGQLVSIFASVGIVSFAAFQAVQTLFGAAIGLSVFCVIWLLYFYSGYSTRLWESRREFI